MHSNCRRVVCILYMPQSVSAACRIMSNWILITVNDADYLLFECQRALMIVASHYNACFVKRVYMAVENREGENSYWMRSIMFSKWWLPLMLIYVKDGKNYSSFYDSNHFHDFFKSMRIEPEQEQEQLVEQVAEEDDIFW